MTTLICLLSIAFAAAFAAALALATRQQEASQQYEAIPVSIAGAENFARRNGPY